MKYSYIIRILLIIKIIIITLFITLMTLGCDIDSKIDDASAKCQNKISELLEGVEEVCLTKEEILELVNSINISGGADTDVCTEEGP